MPDSYRAESDMPPQAPYPGSAPLAYQYQQGRASQAALPQAEGTDMHQQQSHQHPAYAMELNRNLDGLQGVQQPNEEQYGGRPLSASEARTPSKFDFEECR